MFTRVSTSNGGKPRLTSFTASKLLRICSTRRRRGKGSLKLEGRKSKLVMKHLNFLYFILCFSTFLCIFFFRHLSSDTTNANFQLGLRQNVIRLRFERPAKIANPLELLRPKNINAAKSTSYNSAILFLFSQVDSASLASAAVSIVTPILNTDPQLLFETAQSVFSQTFVAFEWLLVDDYSDSNSTLEYLIELSSLDIRVRLLRKSDYCGLEESLSFRGLASARNVGILCAKSDLVVFLDGDDLLDATALEKWWWYLNAHPRAQWVSSWNHGFGAEEYLWQRSVNPSRNFWDENQVPIMSMHRKSALFAVGLFTATRLQLEDWDLWLKLADRGLWGATLREGLTWYRRRQSHSLISSDSIAEFIDSRAVRFPRLLDPNVWPSAPDVVTSLLQLSSPVLSAPPFRWPSAVTAKCILFILPWLVMGGADRFYLELVRGFKQRHWHVTVVTTVATEHTWVEAFQKITSDIFHLDTLAPATSYPSLVHSLIQTRNVGVVFLSNSFHGYAMLPLLLSENPKVIFVDYTHMEEPNFRSGGNARTSVALQSALDLSLVASQRLKNWMVSQGAVAAKVQVEYVSLDLEVWKPNHERRRAVRLHYGLTENNKAVLYACRFVDQKQPLLFADIMVRVLVSQSAGSSGNSSTCNLCAHFFVVGSGGLENDMKQYFTVRLPPHLLSFVHMLGPFSQSEMLDVTLAADIALLTSVMEGIPTTFFEAMGVGAVVVGADVGAISELVLHGKTGFLVSFPGIEEVSQRGLPLVPIEPLFKAAASSFAEFVLLLYDNTKSTFADMKSFSLQRVQLFSLADLLDRLNIQFRRLINSTNKLQLDTTAFASEFYRSTLHLEHPATLIHM